MRMRKIATLAAMALLTFTATAAVADLSVKDGGGTTRTIYNYVCQTTKLCNATVIIDSSGTEVAIGAKLDQLHTDATAAIPAGTNTIGNVGSDPSSGKGTPASAAISVSTATTTQLVALSGTTKIYVTSFDVIAAGTGNITFVYGTGSNCGTGTTSLTGAYNLAAQAGIAKGNGQGAILVVPAGNALCVTTSAAVQMSGSVSYQQF